MCNTSILFPEKSQFCTVLFPHTVHFLSVKYQHLLVLIESLDITWLVYSRLGRSKLASHILLIQCFFPIGLISVPTEIEEDFASKRSDYEEKIKKFLKRKFGVTLSHHTIAQAGSSNSNNILSSHATMLCVVCIVYL